MTDILANDAVRTTPLIVAPGDPDWDDARMAWNLAVDQRPAAVALPESVDEVVAAVLFARDRGLRWLVRKYGAAANSVVGVELVTADGEHIRADAGENPDLFWALRGGGGSFGVVTALEFRLYEIERVFAGALFFGIERSAEVLH